MPRRMIARSFDGIEALELVEVDPLIPGEGRVVIAVRAAGVNPSDTKTLRGVFGRDESKLPIRPGSEVAGVVTAVGSDAVGASGAISVGDEVVAYRVVGGFSDEIITPATNVFRKPASLSFEEASGLMLVGATAWHLLEATEVAHGDTVIVHGASGAVGELVVQLARLRGARVIGTASPRNHDALRALGAEPVAYGDGLVERLRELVPGGADVALDTVGTDEALDASVALVSDRDRIATINGFARGAELGVRMLGGGPGADPGSAIRSAARGPLLDLAGEGKISVRIGRTFPLEDAVAALRFLDEAHPGGKVILLP